MTDTPAEETTHSPSERIVNPWIQHASYLANLKQRTESGKWVAALKEYAKLHGVETRAMMRYQTAYYDYVSLFNTLTSVQRGAVLPSFEQLAMDDAQGKLPTLARTPLGEIETLNGHVAPEKLEQLLLAWLRGELHGQALAEMRQLCRQIHGLGKNATASRVAPPPRGRNAYLRVEDIPDLNWRSMFIQQALSDPGLFGKDQLPDRVVRDLPLTDRFNGLVADLILVYLNRAKNSETAESGDPFEVEEAGGKRQPFDLVLVLFNRPYQSHQLAYETQLGADQVWAVVFEQDDDPEARACVADPMMTKQPLTFGYIACNLPAGQPASIACAVRRQASPFNAPSAEDRSILLQQLLLESLSR